MPNGKRIFPLVLILLGTVSGCGLWVPEKDLFSDDVVTPGQPSPRGKYENLVVAHIRCEIRNGVWNALKLPNVQWLATWGATVTLKMTVGEMSALNPGVSLPTVLENSVKKFPVNGNVTTPQSFALGLGASGSANATRLETIQFTYSNKELLDEAIQDLKTNGTLSCDKLENGIMVQGDLKIGQFIYDKAVVAAIGEASSKNPTAPPYSVLQEDITFVTAFGGSVTPTWHFATITINPTGTLLSATRTSTNDVLITLGPVAQPAKGKSQAQLSAQTQAVHNAGLTGSATASAINAQAP